MNNKDAPRGGLPPVALHGQYIAECPKHGHTNHLTYLGDRCQKCHEEGLVVKGLVKP